MVIPISLVLLACVVGVFVGAIGVGGILLIPPLVLLGNISIHEASATALATFFFTGIYGTWLFHRRGSIDWRIAAPVCLGSLLFSYLGAWVSSLLDSRLLQVIIAGVVGFAGLHALFPRAIARGVSDGIRQRRAVLLLVGALSGLGSGISGAGGPLFSVPLMLLLGFAPLAAIGTAQVLQIASAGAGSIGNLNYGSIHYDYVLWLLAAELAGVYIGAHFAHRLPATVLRTVVALLCVAACGVMLVRR